MALEELGPIFVKFGQVLSTRRDLMPPDIADELALLQDRVPPFDSDLAIAQITRSLRRPPGPAVRQLRTHAGGVGLDRAGALRHAEERQGSRGQGAASGHEAA